jgi:hypothetical protein
LNKETKEQTSKTKYTSKKKNNIKPINLTRETLTHTSANMMHMRFPNNNVIKIVAEI